MELSKALRVAMGMGAVWSALAAGASGVSLEPVRASWPIARDADGAWRVVGEMTALQSGARAAEVTAVRLVLRDALRRPLARRVYARPDELAAALVILGHDADGRPVVKPAGSTRLEPGDTGLLLLSADAAGGVRPAQAHVRVSFRGAPEARASARLAPFAPGQRLRWPLGFEGGPWVALNTAGQPRHWSAFLPTAEEWFISQRHALDAEQIDEAGEISSPPNSARREDYYAWGEDVFSVGTGRVVAVVDGHPDQPLGEVDTANPPGNFVVVRHERPGDAPFFSVYAHLMQGSSAVSVGQPVQPGTLLGRVGNSGNSSRPHLHVHFADRWNEAPEIEPLLAFYLAQGLPALFWDVRVLRGDAWLTLDGSTPGELDVLLP